MKPPKQESRQSSILTLALLYGVCLLLIFFFAYTGNLPTWLKLIPHYDTLGHFILYSLASYLGHRVLWKNKLRLFKLSLPLWPVLFTIFTVVEESIQAFAAYRTFSGVDMCASLLGVAFGYWLARRQVG